MKSTTKQYLYDTIFEELSRKIATGDYPDGTLLPSEREISQQYAVERSTVRHALQLLVDAGLAEKRPGVGTYVRSERENGESALSQRAKKVVGYFMMDDSSGQTKITQPFYSELFYRLEQECKQKNYQLIYFSINEQTDIGEILKGHDFQCAAFVTRMPKHMIEKTRQLGVPLVLINNYLDGYPCVSYDNARGAYKVIHYLHEQGHTKIGLLAGPYQYYSTQKKLEGCCRAFIDCKVPLQRERWVFSKAWGHKDGYDGVKRLWAKCSEENRPTALFVFNDMMAVGAALALRELGLRIPQDISLVGFDNIEQLGYIEPNLTTVDTNVNHMTHILMDDGFQKMIENDNQGFSHLVPVTLTLRETVWNLKTGHLATEQGKR